ncbi:MAG: TIGR03435 family protein [Terracidiphilus sp.]|jgi:uncharacterized protein (TIGR03435 family)
MRSHALAALLIASVFAAPFAYAQSQAGAPAQPSFDAATIKPADKADPASGYWSRPGIGRFYAHSLSIQFLIQLAYGVEKNQIGGKPAWLDSDFYDIEARPEEGIKLSADELKPRLQSLLAERFHLAAHFETKMVRGYALVIAKGGPKLQATKGDHPPSWRIDTSAGHLEGLNWSMPYLAQMLQRATNVPVADETSIAGGYDIKLQFVPDPTSPGVDQDSTLPTLYTALRENLGLELKARQVPTRVLVIDHIDRVPAPN